MRLCRFVPDSLQVASEYLNPLAWDKVLHDIGAMGPEDSVQTITRSSEFIGAGLLGVNFTHRQTLTSGVRSPCSCVHCGCICSTFLCGTGASAPAIAEHVMQLFRITTHTAAELVAKKRAESVASVHRPVSEGGPDLRSLWYSGVEQAVRKLHSNGVDLALCTSNLRPIVNAILEAGSMGDVFRKRIVQEDIGNELMKPDPTPYTRAVSPAI
eukprot:COSAG02_NODE_128_length_34833_cov_44.465221_27_plen_212_part_00